MWSTQGSMTPGNDPDLPRTGVGGTAFGVVGEFGTFLKPRVHEWTFSLSFEFSLPARFDSVTETDYDTVYLTDNRHRDVVFSGLFHVHAPPIGRIHIGVVAGPSVIQEDTLQSTTVPAACCQLPTNLGLFGPETQLTRWTVGLTFCADIGIQINRRVQIVPQIRVHWVSRDESLSNGDFASGSLGLGSWLIQPAVGIRVSF
jgi:hypothetical protein